jgi:tRNA-dihydrouridine synthase
MEKVDDIYPKQMNTNNASDFLQYALEKRLGFPQEQESDDSGEQSNLVLQLGSNHPDRLQSCVERATQLYRNDLREINLNCGCPSIESGGASSYGASLMKQTELTAKLVEAVKNGSRAASTASSDIGISVKCRIAIFDHVDDMVQLDESHYRYLKEYISAIQNAGANHVILHARPAILSGLTPVKNRLVPDLNYDFVERINAEFGGKMDVTLNGGITSLSQLSSLHEDSTSVTSHMAGRWCLRRPMDLVGVEALLLNQDLKLDSLRNYVGKRSENAVQDYIDYAIKMASLPANRQRYTIGELCLPLFLTVEQLGDDYDFDESVCDESEEIPLLGYEEVESLYDIIRDGVSQLEELVGNGKKKNKRNEGDDINFKRLSSSFKALVGTKVANKWKRNRAEL